MARFGFAAVSGLLAVGALSAPAAAAGTGTVQGVFTTSTGTPIPGASVTAYSDDGGWQDQATTDATGHYRLTGVAAGGVELQFDNGGLVHWAPGVRDPDAATSYQLAAGGTLTVDEKQPATGHLAGTFDEPYAEVTAVGVDYPDYLYGNTDGDGAYDVEVLPGTYQVSFRWASAEQWAVQAADQGSATTFTVTAGQTTTVDDHQLPTGTAGGRLTASDGSPLGGVTMTLRRGGRQLGYGFTDEDGTYSFGEVLAGGGYTVSYPTDGGTDLYVPGTADPGKATTFTVAAGENTTTDSVRPGPATVHGTLTDPSGAPKAGFHVGVTLASSGNSAQFSADTAADGTWSVPGVYPGDYRVSFATAEYGRTQWAYQKSDEDTATLIPVTAGGEVTVDDTWLPGATLVVTAVDAASGAPVTGVCANVDVAGGYGCAPAGSNQITLSDLPSGTASLQVSPPDGGYYLFSAARPVTLTPGRTTTATVELTMGGKISYAAADRTTGAAVEGTCGDFLVLGHGGLPDGIGECTGAAGTATSVNLAPGTYEMFAIPQRGGYGYQWVGRSGGTGDQRAAARITVRPGTTVPAPRILLDPRGTITGTVSDAGGAPLAGYDVAYSAWGDAGPGWDTKTDAQGRYRIDVLGPYAWPLLFGGTGYPRQWSGHVANRFEASTVRVVAGGTGTYDFTPARGATVKGKVTSPAPEWRIHAVNAATGDQLGVFDGSAAGAGGAYSMSMIGGQQIKIDWIYFQGGIDVTGWYDHRAGIDSATKVRVPAHGTRTLNIAIG